MAKKPLIILTGPTAVGKSDLSIELAKRINGAIISADSMQVYKGMDIGSAKISATEMDGIKHYLIDILDPKDDFNVADFKRLAKEAVEEIYNDKKIPIVVGGTGFYIQALLYDINFEKEDNSIIRAELEELAEKNGPDYMHDMLKQVDPVSAELIHKNNVKRVIRAIEFFKLNHIPISEHNLNEKSKESPYDFKYFVLNLPRDILYKRIDTRVDKMFEAGLVNEVETLKRAGLDENHVSMQGLGYKEVLRYLSGELTLEECSYIIKRDTRHFAKRQLTWFKRERDVIWVNKKDFSSNDDILKYICEQIKDLEDD